MSADSVTAPSLLTWDELIEHCSRLHTGRRRPWGPGGGELREDSQVLAVTICGQPGEIVPTRMHEPGFYWRLDSEIDRAPRRSASDMTDLRKLVDAGEVARG